MDGARLLAEREFHDCQAAERARTFAKRPDLLEVADEAYLDHETWIRPALARLGPLKDKQVLDFGCGHAMAAVVMARRGARVTAFDLSRGYLAEARQRAAYNEVDIGLVQADGNRLPFATGSFDRVWGNAVLHHLDLAQASAEIARVLRPDGWAIFCEPWGENWFLRLARGRTGSPLNDRTADEEPLRQRDLEIFRQGFGGVDVQGYQLLSMVGRAIRRQGRIPGLEYCDRLLLDYVPSLRRYCRYVVLTLRRPGFVNSEGAGHSQACCHGSAQLQSVACAPEA
jgi:SAM-dependent methyltransferase